MVILAGLGVLALTVLPPILEVQPLPAFVLLLGIGFVGAVLVQDIEVPDPLGAYVVLAELVPEFGVIIALIACGLKLDRPFGFAAGRSMWLLLAITMPLTIVAATALGWWAGLPLPTAVLVEAVAATTDSVLASDVPADPPQHQLVGHAPEDDMRFSLTAEAGLNDGLAFPVANAAIPIPIAGATVTADDDAARPARRRPAPGPPGPSGCPQHGGRPAGPARSPGPGG